MANEASTDFNAMLQDSKGMPKIQIITDDLCLSCTAEYLFKVKRLSFIHNIDNLIRIDFLTAHHQCCKICCIVKRSTV